MKRPKLKKASKRVSCSKRFKIEKKVREHNRKLKKAAKKKGVRSKPKKDIGVPNSAPFKEAVLREAEQKKQKLEALKEQNRLAKQKEKADKRKKEKEAVDSGPAAKKAKKVARVKEARAAVAKEKSAKVFKCRELNKVIEASDVIVEVLDARDPLGCRCPQLEETVLKHEGKKKLWFILNKIDLVPRDNLEKWLHCLQAEYPTFLFKASMLLKDRTVQEKKQRDMNPVLDRSRAASCFGRDSLLQAFVNLANKLEDQTMLKVGVVGFPNVGKSSIINSLKEMRACHVGVQRGLTRCMQEVHISKQVKMIDSPGIVAASSNPGGVMALRSLQIMLQYNVPDYRNSLEFLTLVAKKRGFLQKGGIPDTELAATMFLNDWTGAKLSYHCRPLEPQGLPSHLSEAILTELKSGLDMVKIRKANENVLQSVHFPNLASSISFTSRGPTNGVLDIAELPKEKITTMKTTTITTTEEDKEEEEVEKITADTEEPEAEISVPATEIEESTKKRKARPVKEVKFISIDLTSQQNVSTEDAYDFNTDFV
ncbi:hypothetical protein DNTS_026165 [Danionella cerebrum]|uniref:Guanine nucleotide-binding protein-like 3 n=1 Tax=Danionella cerebrum TaxID=2873325 RepID=A0A553RI23_9TELE|nr:hypothetical protein DNTS_026165 [Danionella translucida]